VVERRPNTSQSAFSGDPENANLAGLVCPRVYGEDYAGSRPQRRVEHAYHRDRCNDVQHCASPLESAKEEVERWRFRWSRPRRRARLSYREADATPVPDRPRTPRAGY
jgi:hypothetical protein